MLLKLPNSIHTSRPRFIREFSLRLFCAVVFLIYKDRCDPPRELRRLNCAPFRDIIALRSRNIHLTADAEITNMNCDDKSFFRSRTIYPVEERVLWHFSTNFIEWMTIRPAVCLLRRNKNEYKDICKDGCNSSIDEILPWVYFALV